MSRHERTLTVNPDRLKPEWGERKRWVKCGSAGELMLDAAATPGVP